MILFSLSCDLNKWNVRLYVLLTILSRLKYVLSNSGIINVYWRALENDILSNTCIINVNWIALKNNVICETCIINVNWSALKNNVHGWSTNFPVL